MEIIVGKIIKHFRQLAVCKMLKIFRFSLEMSWFFFYYAAYSFTDSFTILFFLSCRWLIDNIKNTLNMLTGNWLRRTQVMKLTEVTRRYNFLFWLITWLPVLLFSHCHCLQSDYFPKASSAIRKHVVDKLNSQKQLLNEYIWHIKLQCSKLKLFTYISNLM